MIPASTISLSIIIVNYRSAALVVDCIRSVRKFNQALTFEIIVVDNDSGDDIRERILQEDGVRFFQMGYNAGFARANNRGMEESRGGTFLLLNPDTLAVDDSITRCYQQLNQADCLACGVQIRDEDGNAQISGSYFVKGGLNHLLPIPYWGGFIRWLAYRSRTRVPNVQEVGAREEVDWISGAFLMVKREAVQKAGMMDEDFFLYAEEVEWCSRLRKSGKLCLFGDLQIIHLEGGSINKHQQIEEKGYYNLYDKKGLQLMVSNHLRVRKQYGVGWFLFLLLNYTWGWIIFAIAGFIHHLFTLRNPFGHGKQLGAFGSNLLKLWSFMPAMIANKPHFYKMF